MAKAELGTKRIDPETGRKFYDLNRDPIVSPYTGLSYPRSYFEETVEVKIDEEETEEELDTVLEKPEFISLEEADEDGAKDSDLPDLGDDDVDLGGDDDDDAFLATDDDDGDDDVAGIFGGGVDGDDDI